MKVQDGRYFLVAGLLLPLAAIFAFGTALAQGNARSDDEIRRAIVSESIGSYAGNCPCPESRQRTGAGAEADLRTAAPVARQ